MKTFKHDLASARPLLSIVIAGRDDDYMPDFRYRLTTTLDYLAAGLARSEQLHAVEALITDWGSRVSLAESMLCTPEAASISRFVYVPSSMVRQLQGGRDAFHISLAINVGLRRASGQFVMVSAADTLFTAPALDVLLRLLSGQIAMPVDVRRTFFLCRRYHVPWQFVKRQPTLDEWQRHLLLHAGEYAKNDSAVFGNSSGAGALLMSRQMWHDLRGLDERLGGWGHNDIELGLRVNQQYPWLDLSYLGICSFHMQHQPGEGRRASAVEQWRSNPRIHNLKPIANAENWGLADRRLPVQPASSVNHAAASKSRSQMHPAGREIGEPDMSNAQVSGFGSVDEIERQLASPEICRRVENTIQQVKATFPHWVIDRTDLEALLFLGWYACYHFPRRYLEFGISRGYSAALVGRCCPGVEIYGIDRWEKECDYYSPTYIADLRQQAAHCGYLRFVNGDPNTGLRRLRASFVGPCEFDLVLLREETVCDVTVQSSALLKHLAPGGGLVLRGRNAPAFESLWNEIRMGHSHHTCLRPVGASTGLIVNAAVAHDPDCPEWETLAPLATERLKVMIDRLERPSHVRAVLPRIARALMRPQRYAEYASRAIRWLGRTSGRIGGSRLVKAENLRGGGP